MAMSAQAADRLALVDRLAPGDRLILYGIDWEDYGELIDRLGDDSHLRISYSEGRLEAMSPSTPHETSKYAINRLVTAICDELKIDVVSVGSFTMKVDRLRKGAEADDSFYIQHASTMIGRDHLELGVDPPPDLVVEIDLTRDSRKKFEIYASFGVPEIWRYEGGTLSVFLLTDGTYLPGEFSACFPFLSANNLSELLAGVSAGTYQAWESLREWLRANKPGSNKV